MAETARRFLVDGSSRPRWGTADAQRSRHAIEAVRELPVDGHRVQTESTHRCHQGLSPCSDGRHRPVKGVTVIERDNGVVHVTSNVPKQCGDASEASAGLHAFIAPQIEDLAVRRQISVEVVDLKNGEVLHVRPSAGVSSAPHRRATSRPMR